MSRFLYITPYLLGFILLLLLFIFTKKEERSFGSGSDPNILVLSSSYGSHEFSPVHRITGISLANHLGYSDNRQMGMEIAAATQTAPYNQMDDANFTDSELSHFVKHALKSVSLGDVESYNELIGVIHHNKGLSLEDVALLVTSLKALSGAVSYIDIAYHEALLDSIFRLGLWNYGTDVMDAVLELVVSLAASNGKHIDSCLDMLVNNFMPPHYLLDSLNQPNGLVKKDEVLSRVHAALSCISELLPLAPVRLASLLNQRMPYIGKEESLISIYVENMLKLEGSAIGGIIGSEILVAVVDRLIDLDLEIAWDDVLEESSKGMFTMELEDLDESDDEVEAIFGELRRAGISRRPIGSKPAHKLDSLMVLTFEHLKSCAKSGRLTEVFETLFHSFRKTVLNAYKSKFAQFVIFYACSLDAQGCGVEYANRLVDMFSGNNDPPLYRMSAVAYLASYLSRAKFLSPSFVVDILNKMVKWCLKYCQVHDGDINPIAHRVFYSGCQAIMYTLCFRMRSIISLPLLKSKLLATHIQQILAHPLSPLKVCLPSIVHEFLQQAKDASLFTVSEAFIFDDVLESDHSKAFGGFERLDMLFPFDPCLLRKSDSFIRPSYIYWSMVNEEDDDDENENEDEDYPDGFDKMSITPRNRQMVMPSRIRPSMSPQD